MFDEVEEGLKPPKYEILITLNDPTDVAGGCTGIDEPIWDSRNSEEPGTCPECEVKSGHKEWCAFGRNWLPDWFKRWLYGLCLIGVFFLSGCIPAIYQGLKESNEASCCWQTPIRGDGSYALREGEYAVRNGEWIDFYRADGCAEDWAFVGNRLISEKESAAHSRKLNRQNKARGFNGPYDRLSESDRFDTAL